MILEIASDFLNNPEGVSYNQSYDTPSGFDKSVIYVL